MPRLVLSRLLVPVPLPLASLLFGCQPAPTEIVIPPSPSPTVQAATPQVPLEPALLDSMETQIRQQINAVRQSHGLGPLQPNNSLAQVARNHSQQMASRGFFDHTDHRGEGAFERVQSAGIPFRLVAENLFMSENAPQPVALAVKGWMNSPGHRANILRAGLTHTGVGIFKKGDTYYFTQLFIQR